METYIFFRNFLFRGRIKLDLQRHILEFNFFKPVALKILMEMSINMLELIKYVSGVSDLAKEKIVLGGHIRDT